MAAKRSYESFFGELNGKSVIVCGCGPSVKLLNDPSQHLTIGVNDIGRLFTPNYLVVVNSVESFKDGRGEFVKNTECKTVFSQYDNLSINNKNSLVKIAFGRRSDFNPDDRKQISFSNNSPYVGAIIAYHMGAKRIGLLGVDFTKHHFFRESGVHRLNRSLDKIKTDYKKLKDSFVNNGVEFYNLSPESAVDTLPYLSIEEFSKFK